jgi:acetyl esterase/lipase
MIRFFVLMIFWINSFAQDQVKLMTAQQFQAIPTKPADQRIAYGSEIDQFGELRLPAGSGPHPVVILIHGGCWRADFSNLHELGPIAEALRRRGIATWNLEYRRLGQAGAGWPGTYVDIGRGVDQLRVIAAKNRLDVSRVVVLGHSAGGHLAMWVASRQKIPEGSSIHSTSPLAVRGVIDLAGTPDMTAFFPLQKSNCGGRAVVEEMLGGTPAEVPQRYAAASAINMLPLGVMQTVVWGERDDIAPISLGENYVKAAKQRNENVSLLKFEGIGHFEIATPFPPSWPLVEKEILRMLSK